MLDELHWQVAQAADEAARRLALETLIEACVPATLIAKNLGYLDLAQAAARAGKQRRCSGIRCSRGRQR